MNTDLFLHYPALQALGYAIFHSLWQSFLLFLLLRLALLFMDKPAARYRFQYAALTVLFVVFISTFLLQWYVISTSISAEVYPATDTLYGKVFGVSDQHRINGWQHLLYWHHSGLFKRLLPFVIGSYILGIIIHSLRMLLAFRNMYSLQRYILPASDEMITRFAYVRQLLGMRQKVGLFISEHINTPLMMGHLKPFIVLPLALMNNLDSQQTEAILLHELAHIRRKDYLLNLFQMVMETLMFFNPLVWWLSGWIRKERELACDDMVVGYTSSPLKYAEALFKLEENRLQLLQPAMAATGNDKKQVLLHRIKRIIEMKRKTTKTPQGIMASLTVLMILVTMVSFFAVNAQDIPKDKKKETTAKVRSSTKTVVTVKDKEGKVHTYKKESHDPVHIEEEIAQALQTMQGTMSKIDEKKIASITEEAMASVDAEEVKKAMVEARKELQNINWDEISQSIEEASGALKAIDWEEIGRSINEGLKSAEGIGGESFKKAMQEAKKALDEGLRETTGKSGMLIDEAQEVKRKQNLENGKQMLAQMKQKQLLQAEENRKVIMQMKNEVLLKQKETREKAIAMRNKLVEKLKQKHEKNLEKALEMRAEALDKMQSRYNEKG